MQNLLPWIIAGLSALAVLGLLAALLLRRPRRERKPLPTEWSLSPRPVFSADERRVFRLLREALPHHVVLCKLPVVRFCQPTEARDVRYWYELLGGISVNFAICSPNGRVLAAIDLETDRPGSSRSLQIKQAVLAAIEITGRRWKARGGDPNDIWSIAVWAVPAGLIGSRLYHVITDWKTYFGEGGKPLFMHPSPWVGLSFTVLLLVVIVATSVRARGINALLLILLMAGAGAATYLVMKTPGLWAEPPALLLHMNLAFYLLISSVLFLVWFMTTDAVPREFTSMTPYIATLLVLAFASQRLRMPKADGQIYRKGSAG